MLRKQWAGVCAVLVGSLSGCPNPNLYTTPRTLPPGTVQWQVAPEWIGVSYNAPTGTPPGTPQTNNVTATLPMVPSGGIRVGLVEGIDLGAHLQNFDSLETDVKFRLLKGVFDIAVNPGIQGYYVEIGGTSLGVGYVHLPILLGINFSEKTSLVLSPGVVYSFATASVNGGSGVQGSATATGFMGRLGVGFDFRVTPHFAIHPELTFMHQFADQDLLLWVAGVGFNFGAMPDYSDLGGGAPPPPPTPGPPPPAPGPPPPAGGASVEVR